MPPEYRKYPYCLLCGREGGAGRLLPRLRASIWNVWRMGGGEEEWGKGSGRDKKGKGNAPFCQPICENFPSVLPRNGNCRQFNTSPGRSTCSLSPLIWILPKLSSGFHDRCVLCTCVCVCAFNKIKHLDGITYTIQITTLRKKKVYKTNFNC